MYLGLSICAFVFRIENLTSSLHLSPHHHPILTQCAGDLKPQNIGFNHEGNAILFDFGLSRELPALDCTQRFKMSGKVGTIRYMAPEVCLYQSYSTTCDIYSWAMVAYEALRQAKPFEGFTPDIYTTLVCQQGVRPNDSIALQYNTTPTREFEQPLSHNLVVLLQHAWEQQPERRLPLASISNQLELLKQKERLLLEAEELHELTSACYQSSARGTGYNGRMKAKRSNSGLGGFTAVTPIGSLHDACSVVSSTGTVASSRSVRSARSYNSYVSASSLPYAQPPSPSHVVSPDPTPAMFAAEMERSILEIQQMQRHRHEVQQQKLDDLHMRQQYHRRSHGPDEYQDMVMQLQDDEDSIGEIHEEPLNNGDGNGRRRKIPIRRHSDYGDHSLLMQLSDEMRRMYECHSYDNICDVQLQDDQRHRQFHEHQQRQIQRMQQQQQQQLQQQNDMMTMMIQNGGSSWQPGSSFSSYVGKKGPSSKRQGTPGRQPSRPRRQSQSMSPDLLYRKDLNGSSSNRTAETDCITLDSLWSIDNNNYNNSSSNNNNYNNNA